MIDVIQLCIQANAPVLVWGPPGTGKTSYVASLGRALAWHTEVLIASIRDPADFGGYPVVREGRFDFAPAPWARRIAETLGADANARALLVLDEIAHAPPAVQAALLRVVLDKVVGDTVLPADRVSVVAMANPVDVGGGFDLSLPLLNRFVHIDWNFSIEDWKRGMLSGWPDPQPIRLPVGWEAELHAARALVAGFLDKRAHLALVVPGTNGKATSAPRAYPTPRSWDVAARLIAALRAVGGGKDDRLAVVAACIGDGAAIEFIRWEDALDLPDPETLLAKPGSFKLPDRGDQQYAVLGSVVAAALRKLTNDRWQAAWEVLGLAAKQGGADVAASAARALAGARQKDPSLALPTRHIQALLPLLKATGELVARA